MADFTIIETIAYQWVCELCGQTSELEISRLFAKEAAQQHQCPTTTPATAAQHPSHDHDNRCCTQHKTHVNPHRGCILR